MKLLKTPLMISPTILQTLRIVIPYIHTKAKLLYLQLQIGIYIKLQRRKIATFLTVRQARLSIQMETLNIYREDMPLLHLHRRQPFPRLFPHLLLKREPHLLVEANPSRYRDMHRFRMLVNIWVLQILHQALIKGS